MSSHSAGAVEHESNPSRRNIDAYMQIFVNIGKKINLVERFISKKYTFSHLNGSLISKCMTIDLTLEAETQPVL